MFGSFDAETIRNIIVTMITLVLSITVHEFGHAFVAHKLGDDLPLSQGRVTLNPMAHADPLGTLVFPLIGLIASHGNSIGFGWGRPVMVNPVRFTRRFRMKTGHMMVAAAGPAMNILFGLFISLVLWGVLRAGVIEPVVFQQGQIAVNPLYIALRSAVYINFTLAAFNLIPVPPLDGGTVLAGVLPDRAAPVLDTLQRYGMYILFVFILVPQASAIFLRPAMLLARGWLRLLGV